MANHSTNVIPFNFGKQQVRTMLVGDQPWFVASDVSAALLYSEASAMTRHLDEDEKGLSIVQTLGGEQEMLVINESGLYSAILRSRKAEAKCFKKWVTAEVLPAIRKHGRYEDSKNVMVPMVEDILGKTGALRLSNVIRCRVAKMSSEHQRSATAKLASALHACFGVPRVELIPAAQFQAAVNFVASYAIEGEYLGPEQAKPQLDIHYPLEALVQRRPEMLEHRGMGQAWLDVSMGDICARPQDLSLCEKILCELRDAGYEIDGAWFEVRSLRNRLHQLNSFLTGLGAAMQQPTRYAVEVSDGRAAA
ncbi:BRO-N domain-containing protein [Pseudomonas laurentiana]|uniref:Bro-N domain-containing protein n=1 Tax=Pseudomonas laurentiana TaxID=2364649 RepID=A0A6I5RNN5_9PSED|nr:Bro-N domain-containing protein [Pseudomonas laurentiana]NES09299.1 hypothetical protein [Pseudomonas laurentiana]